MLDLYLYIEPDAVRSRAANIETWNFAIGAWASALGAMVLFVIACIRLDQKR